MHYRLFSTVETVLELASTWKNLPATHVFQTFDFVASWAELHDFESMAVVVGYRQGKAVGILPCCVRRIRGIRLLVWAPSRFILDYGDILLDPDAGIDASEFMAGALDHALSMTGCVTYMLIHVREDAHCYPFLQSQAGVFSETSAPYLPMERSFDAVMADVRRCRKSQRADCERCLRRLSEAGTVSFRFLRGGEPEAPALLDAVLQQKERNLANAHSMLNDARYRGWYQNRISADECSFVAVLELDSKIIAGVFGFVYQSRLYYLVPSFDGQFSAYSPGRLLIYLIIKEFSEKILHLDLCISNPPYKREWTDQSCRIQSFLGNRSIANTIRKLAGVKRRMVQWSGR